MMTLLRKRRQERRRKPIKNEEFPMKRSLSLIIWIGGYRFVGLATGFLSQVESNTRSCARALHLWKFLFLQPRAHIVSDLDPDPDFPTSWHGKVDLLSGSRSHNKS
jgi:hypothetical protein